jgi:hypothetical protein
MTEALFFHLWKFHMDNRFSVISAAHTEPPSFFALAITTPPFCRERLHY